VWSSDLYEVPLIGHYVPYTNLTHDDLQTWFDGNGYYPGDHDSILNTFPNPISSNIIQRVTETPLMEEYFPRADPWWIIYQHPNRRITDPVLARIEYDLKGLYGNDTDGYGKQDFLVGNGGQPWSEWTMTADDLRTEWADGFTGGFKYAVLQYDTSTQFKKITLSSFFNMPIGDEFDCRNEWANQITHGNGPNNIK
jgi:hypothetical protein